MVTMTSDLDPQKPTAPPTPSPAPQRRSQPDREDDTDANDNLQMRVAMKMIGSAMVFIGFLQVFLAAQTGAEITVFPMFIYFGGMALWAHSSVEHATTRYLIIAFSLLCALAFFHYGEVLFWHIYVIYWGTVLMVVYFMFKTQKNPTSGQ
ncbi:MAG: hypothetical protein NPIRA02_34150 [Nitrospirales bacterium]|nr:MAG: hypothetical protein NPIRA02_34150 [Nitrospirales bacterium]